MEQDLVTPRNSPSALLCLLAPCLGSRTVRQASFMESKSHSWVEQSTPALGLGAYPCF